MCGIAGIIRFDGRAADARYVQAQVELLRHRGPDGEGVWVRGPVGLGHTRLAIIDVSPSGAQPMHLPDASGTLVYNGELYNTEQVRGSLRHPPHFRGTSDTEVLLHALREDGASALGRLEGMFAFAWHDAQTGTVLLARDVFGIKPLYLHRNARRLVFASEISPVLADPETPRRANVMALRQHALLGYAPDPDTAFQEIHRLEPGTWLEIFPDGRSRSGRFASIDDLLHVPVHDLRATFEESARRHAVADVPTGLFLSGGLDSSLLLAAIAQGGLPPHFRAYNVGVEEDSPIAASFPKLERRIARATCQHFGAELSPIDAMARETPSIASMIESVEEPIANPSNAMIDLVCASARRRGTKVLLSGHGGDEVFAGYRRHVWARHLSTLRRAGAAPLMRLAAAASGRTALRRMAASLAPQDGLDPLVSTASMGWDLVMNHAAIPGLMSRADVAGAVAPLRQLLDRWRGHSPLKQMMLLDLHTYLTAQNLVNMDKVSMRQSVEVRVPFLYRPLVAIGLQLPDRALVQGRRNKIPLRRLATETLPPFLLDVPKLGFGPPQVPLVQGEEGQELLLGRTTRERGLEDIAVVQGLVRRLGPTDENLAIQLYGLAAIEQWHRSFIDRVPARIRAS